MSYRLINANDLNGVISDADYEKVLNMPCVFADLPNGMDGKHYDLQSNSDKDCISRAQALSDYADWFGYGYRDNTFYKRLKNMPSVQPKPKTDVLDKIKEEIKDNTYFINETTEKEGIDFETVEKIIDKYTAESEKTDNKGPKTIEFPHYSCFRLEGATIEQQIHEFAELMYKAGYEDGEKDTLGKTICKVQEVQKAYQDGFEKGTNVRHGERERIYCEGYNEGLKDGLNDAWECARKILFDYTLTDVKEKFGTDTFCGIIEKYSASETIAKIKEYEEKQKRVEIEVGDEVCLMNGKYHSVVASFFEEGKKAVLITQNGKWTTEFISNLRKTGRHFKEIEYVLKQMKGDNNE